MSVGDDGDAHGAVIETIRAAMTRPKLIGSHKMGGLLARGAPVRTVARVFINWFRSEARTAAGDDRHLFVERITVRRPRRPVDRLVVGGWTLILIKCVLASIAIRRWDIPIHDFYVWGPSFIFGALCTYLYLTREEP